jgi:hypothetical protein
MEFSPGVDHLFVTAVNRTLDLRNAAEVWRALRRRARRLNLATPCYESVRKLVRAERERRARLLATLATLLELGLRRVPVLPEQVPPIYARNLIRSRAQVAGEIAAPT